MIYVDTCLVIYAIEDNGTLGQRSRALFQNPDLAFAISPLVIMEALVAPLQTGNLQTMDAYQHLFSKWNVIDLDIDSYVRAAELRAASPGLKTIDALHLAAAQLAGCSALWTNDKRLAAASVGLAVDVMHD